MAPQLTKRDCEILVIWMNNSPSHLVDWDGITTAGGFADRKSARKAVRRVVAKLPSPPQTTGTLATQPQREPQATLPRPKKVAKRSNVSGRGSKTSKQGKNVSVPRIGTNSAIMRNRGSGTRSSPTGRLRKEEEEVPGLGRERAGAGIGGGFGEGEGHGVGEGVGQWSGQGSDRFVVGKPYNENHDRDYRLSRRERLRGDESSEDESESESSMDEEQGRPR